MYTRPNPKETEEDILKQQEEFLKKKANNEIKLAAKVVSDKVDRSQAIEPPGPTKPPQLENTFESIPVDISIGKIVENKEACLVTEPNFVHKRGFPQAKRRDPTLSGSRSSSIFSQQMKRLKKDDVDNTPSLKMLVIKENTSPSSVSVLMDVEKPVNSNIKPLASGSASGEATGNFPDRSCIIAGEEKEDIHQQNVQLLQNMTEEEILEEQQKLLSMMDPALVAFLKAKRREVSENKTPSIAEQNKAAESVTLEKVEASKEITSHEDADKWLNFDVVETGKLAWMTNVDIPKIKKGKSYEARFDFDGWLLPFAAPEIDEKNRILYHHGDEPGRPGYTLQELFQLSRSSVIQQKIIALNTIANLLALQQSGVYDDIIDLPLEQIFFVVRFCLDDNTPAILNAAVKGMRNLFFYTIDETCLDNLLGFGLGMIQPILAVDNAENEDDNTVNDQQLAETNLVKCLVRTDMLRRIRYIVNTVQPAMETVVYCLEILIRMARDSDFIVKQILNCEDLLDGIVKHFLPENVRTSAVQSAYGWPLAQAVKLFRVLLARSQDIAEKVVKKWKIVDRLAAYLSDESLSVNSNGLKLQIEVMHTWCVLIHYKIELQSVRALEPVLWRMLDFHIQTTSTQTASYVIQGHVAALLNLLGETFKADCVDMSVFIPILSGLAATKWTAQFVCWEEFSCGRLQIITALFKCLDGLRQYTQLEVNVVYSTRSKLVVNVENLLKILHGKGFSVVTTNIRNGSNLLTNYEVHKCSANLKTVEAAVWNASDHIIPTICTKSCIPFLCILSDFIATSQNSEIKMSFIKHENIQRYLTLLNKVDNYSLINNWFTKVESRLIANILRVAVSMQKNLDTALFYEISVKCLSIFDSEQKGDIEFILTSIVFSPQFYPCDVLVKNLNINEGNDLLKETLKHIYSISMVYTEVLEIKNKESQNLSVESGTGNVMPVDWIYSPIILLYSNQQQNVPTSEEKQIFIVTNCLRWIYLYEIYFPSLAKLINPTDRFCRIACTFLGSDNLFLIPEIHDLLEACFKLLLASNEQNINFRKPIQGLNNFQDFYTQLLEQYQGVSYGNVLFGNFILLPLIQRHDVKYRKVLWSEYAGVVQICSVTPEQVLCPNKLFLNPIETDISLLKCYRRALTMGIIRKHSFLYQIAKHHVDAFISSRNSDTDVPLKNVY